MTTIDLPLKGGSGSGITRWLSRGTGCLIAADLEDSGIVLLASRALMIGTMFHKYAELYYSRKIKAEERLTFTLGGEPIDDEWQDEAYRLYCAYVESDILIIGQPILATELHISGPEVEKALGVSPYTAMLDLLYGTKDNAALVDFKTSARSGNIYNTGRTKLQMHAYWLAAVSAGYNVRSIWIHQIVRTKKVQCHEYQIDLPTPGQLVKLRRFLANTKKRWECGERMPLLPFCDSCPYRQHGHCIK